MSNDARALTAARRMKSLQPGGDAEGRYSRILDEYRDGSDAGPWRRHRCRTDPHHIRQISQAKNRLAAIEKELGELQQSEIALLRQDAEAARQEGRDLFEKLAASVRERIASGGCTELSHVRPVEMAV